VSEEALIEASELSAGYAGATVVRSLNLAVYPGEVVALLGANGAGKTTTLLALAGEIPLESGTVRWLGSETKAPLYRRVRQGLAFVPEDRGVFTQLTTQQNMQVRRGCDIAKAIALFPDLDPILGRRGGLLSGGEQQMLSLGRALARPTKLLLADELSLGLAPKMVGRLLRAVRSAADDGMGALVVEQHVHRVLAIADRALVLRRGVLEFSGSADEARAHIEEIQGHYLTGT
jgi:branched-chain amino acid transport system ATP-binding protein